MNLFHKILVYYGHADCVRQFVSCHISSFQLVLEYIDAKISDFKSTNNNNNNNNNECISRAPYHVKHVQLF